MFRAQSDVFWGQNNAHATRSTVFRARNNVFRSACTAPAFAAA